MTGDDAGARLKEKLTSPAAKKFGAGLALVAVSVTALYLVAQSRGIVATIVYAFLFMVSATLFPVAIGLFGNAIPNAIGKLHLVLGAVAFDHHYLVQRQNRWEWCPGDRGRVYIDDEWHDIDGGEENYSVLGWRPFGILRFKDDATWAERRVDTKAKRLRGATETDGGGETVTRAGIQEVNQPMVSGVDGTWLLDLKRVFTRGVQKIGDIELIETAEEVIERGQVEDGRVSNAGPLAETLAGLILGVMTGLGYVFLF